MAENGTEQPAISRRRPLKRALSLAAELLLLIVIVLAVDSWMTRNNAHGMAPPLQGRSISGEYFSMDHLKGEVALIHFWGTWCPLCNLEQETIDAIDKDHRLMSVALQSGSDEDIGQYLHKKGVQYPVLNDHSGAISASYGVSSVPTTFVLDRHGEIRYVTRGYSSELGLRFRLWLASL